MKLHPKQNGKRSTGAAIFLGVLLVLAAFLVNKWSIELLISSDGDISSYSLSEQLRFFRSAL